MTHYTIVASDLDGTLLSNDSTLSRENTQAITVMNEKGVQFVPASGRTLREMPPAVLEHPDIRYYIYANGAAIWDKQTNTHTLLCMPQAVSNRVLDTLAPYQCHITVRQGGCAYADATMLTEDDFSYYQINDLHRIVLERYAVLKEEFIPFARTLNQVECYALFFHDDTEMEACRIALQAIPGVSVAFSFPHCLELFSDKAGKGYALHRLADILQVPYDTTISVGDNGNDLSMIQMAGLGLATKNACEALKSAADVIICSNEDHIVPYIIQKFL